MESYVDKSKVSLRPVNKKLAKDMIEQYHYSGVMSACRFTLGVFYKSDNHKFFDGDVEDFIGVACYGFPVGRRVIGSIFKEDIMPLIFGGGIIAGLLPVLYLSAKEIAGPSIGKLVDKLKKNKNYKMSDSEKSDVKGFVSKVKKDKPSLLQKAMKKIKEEVEEVKESYEIGTDEYREYTQKLTPGQEIQKYGDFKVQSMKEALKKVWGLDEKRLDKTEEDDKIAPVKGKKSMTGGDVADVKVDPEMKKESK